MSEEQNPPAAETPSAEEKKGLSKGKVKWYNRVRGYGFIVSAEGEGDIFFHHSVVEGTGKAVFEDGEEVEYEGGAGKKGPAAKKVIKQAKAS